MQVAPFNALPADARPIAGGKGACLARMAGVGLPVPPGFVVCAAAFEAFLEGCGGAVAVVRRTRDLDVQNTAELESTAADLRGLIARSSMPQPLEDAIREAYARLGADALVAVRSSAVSEDGDAASFAGQQETYLNVRGAAGVTAAVKACWASFFEPRALFYRAAKGALADTQMAVVVQQMVQSEKSGVMFTIDPVQKRRDRMVIEAVFGLGEGIVSGLLTPNHYLVDRDDGTVLDAFVGYQPFAVVHDPERGGTQQVPLTEEEGSARVLSEPELDRLRQVGLRLEECFGGPQDVEWGIRGEELLLLQSRPVTTL
jgi:pyruvate, water dikinase